MRMVSVFFRYKHVFFASILILLLSLIFRITNLNSIPVFADEAIYIRWSQIMRAEESLRFLPLSDGKQPLFMWITIPFLKILDDPLVAGRLVSVFSGLGSTIGVSILAFILFKSWKVGLLAALIYSILPYTVFFDRLAVTDSLLSFFGIWAIVFGVLTVQYSRLDTAMIAGFFLGGALLTKSPGLYFALLLPTVLIMASWPKTYQDKFKKLSVYVFLFTFTYAIGFGLQNILRLGTNFHMIALRNADYVYPLNHVFSSPFDPLKPFLIRNSEYIWILGTPLFVLLILWGLNNGIKKYIKPILLLLVFALVPILISSEYSKTMTARYVYPSIPYFVIIAALPFLTKSSVLINKIKFFLLLLFSFILIHKNYVLIQKPHEINLPRSERSGYLEEWTSGYGIREISEYMKTEYNRSPEEKIVIGTEGYFGTLPDGLQIYLNNIPEITVIGVGQPVRNLPQSLAESRDVGNKTYLVVNDTRLLLEAEKSGLELIASYSKATKPDGNTEKLLLFQLVTPPEN